MPRLAGGEHHFPHTTFQAQISTDHPFFLKKCRKAQISVDTDIVTKGFSIAILTSKQHP